MRKIFLYILIISFSYPDLNKPNVGENLRYIHILFEWEQQPDAVEYQIQLSDYDSFEDNSNLLLDIQTSKLVYIYKDSIDWGSTYFWRVRDVYADNSYGPWTLASSFTIDEKTGEPGLRIFNNCRNLLKTLPLLPTDKHNPEDVDTNAEDHAYDALRYGVMSRPLHPNSHENDQFMKQKQKEIFKPADRIFGY